MTTALEHVCDTAVPERFLPGDLVQVRSEAEILRTLDEHGTLENLPFMPEMLKLCGRRLRVSRQAFKTCVDDQEMRQLDNTVFLEEARCDGSSHGGCGRACLIFWKAPWLKRVEPSNGNGGNGGVDLPRAKVERSDLISLATRDGQFFCQSSELLNASKPLPWWQPRQYFWDLKYNRIPVVQLLQSMFIAFYDKLAHVCGFKSWRFIAGSGRLIFHSRPSISSPANWCA